MSAHDKSPLRPRPKPELLDGADQLDRRELFRLLGAALAASGVGSLAGCARPPAEKIVPYRSRPPEMTPGNWLHYATMSSIDGDVTGLLVRCREGRPIKVEGNPEHPSALGASGHLEQALVMSLYDVGRLRRLTHRGRSAAVRAFFATLASYATRLEKNGGRGLYLFTEPNSSPLLQHLKRRLKERFPEAVFLSYAPLSKENRYLGTRLAFGRPLEPVYDFLRADVVLSLDADFLDCVGHQLAYARAMAERRVPREDATDASRGMNRLYVVEPSLTVTGGFADHRLRLRPSQVESFARRLVQRLAESVPELAPLAAPVAGPLDERAERWLSVVARDLLARGGRVAVVAGERQSPLVHALAQAMNVALGATRPIAPPVRYVPPAVDTETGPESYKALAASLARGEVDLLVLTASNPVYAGFADVGLGPLLERAGESVYLTLREDETSRHCSWVVPALHPFESWGDGRAWNGTVTLQQPLIEPLVQGVQECELYAVLANATREPQALLKQLYGRDRPGFDITWTRWLKQGLIEGSEEKSVDVRLDARRLVDELRERRTEEAEGNLEAAFARDYAVYDGRFADIAWLQELPDPVTKLTWDNAALLSPGTAESLGVSTGDVLEVRHPVGGWVRAPAYVLPGHADGVVTLPLGYGRRAGGPVALGRGFDAYALRYTDRPWFTPVTVRPTGERFPLAITQEHWELEGRPIAFSAPVAELENLARELEHRRGPLPTLHAPVSYEGEPYKWGMALDLSRCTGCSACVLACQAENNVPVVGKPEVARSREMHWLRIDRYFLGEPDEPEVLSQPMLCQHCETAPCEYVCPVNATVHSDEGLNVMVYNRCVGTRYCSNNCPYKVRRFNYFAYNDDKPDIVKLAMNPDVTVRARGVMEKCTYCVQRIERARIDAKLAGRRIGPDELKTACQQACPTKAIVFGSLNDPDSPVARLHRDARRFDVLHELGTRPRNAYLARVRNPHPEL